MKAMRLKMYGVILFKSYRYIIYNYQEQNQRKRYFNYLVELRGPRYCLIRRLNEEELETYKSIIEQDNYDQKKNA